MINRYWFGLLIFAGMAGVGVATFAQHAARLGSVQRALENSFLRWSLVYVMFGVMGALICAAHLLSASTGNWRFVPLVLINMVMQPLCGFAVTMCGYKLIMAVTGRMTYGFQIIPREGIDPVQYRTYCLFGAVGGMLGVLFFGSMGLACLLPLLKSPATKG